MKMIALGIAIYCVFGAILPAYSDKITLPFPQCVEVRQCAHCGRDFVSHGSAYCSEACRKAAQNKR